MSEIKRSFPGLWWVVMAVGTLLVLHGSWFVLGDPESYSSGSYDVVKDYAPIQVWGWVWITIGLAEVFTINLPKHLFIWCRMALLSGVVMSLLWFFCIAVTGPTASPFAVLALVIPQAASMIEDPDKRLIR